MEYVPSESFNILTDKGEEVRIVGKQPDPQKGTVLVADDGRKFVDDYNTPGAPYELVEEKPKAKDKPKAKADEPKEPQAAE